MEEEDKELSVLTLPNLEKIGLKCEGVSPRKSEEILWGLETSMSHSQDVRILAKANKTKQGQTNKKQNYQDLKFSKAPN